MERRDERVIAGLEPRAERPERGPPPHGAERLRPPARDRHHGGRVNRFGDVQESREKRLGAARHVRREDEIRLLRRERESRGDAERRGRLGRTVGHVGKAGVAERLGVLPDEGDAPAHDRELLGLMERHRDSPVGQARLVAAHPLRATAHEDEPVWHRGGMVPPSPASDRIAVIVPVAAGEGPPPGIFFERVLAGGGTRFARRRGRFGDFFECV